MHEHGNLTIVMTTMRRHWRTGVHCAMDHGMIVRHSAPCALATLSGFGMHHNSHRESMAYSYSVPAVGG